MRHDEGFQEFFPVLDDQERFARTQPQPGSYFIVVDLILTVLGIGAVWAFSELFQ